MTDPSHDPRNPLKQLADIIRRETGVNISIIGAFEFMYYAVIMLEMSEQNKRRADFIEAFNERTRWDKTK